IFLDLLFGAELKDMIGAKRIVSRYAERDRTVYARQFFNDRGIGYIAHTSAVDFFGEEDSHQIQFSELWHQFAGKMLRLIPFHYVWGDLAFCKFAYRAFDLKLLFSQFEDHIVLSPIVS